MVYRQHAGAFFLSRKFMRTLPVALNGVYGECRRLGRGSSPE
jgi:hypothetical protein